MARWIPLPLDRLPSLAKIWHVIDFHASVPPDLQGRLLLEVHRGKRRVALVELPELGPMLLLRMRYPIAWLTPSASGTIVGQRLQRTNTWILALMPGNGGEFPAGPVRLISEDGWPGLAGNGIALKPMQPFRPWSWRWSPTCGCGQLTVYVERGREEIQRWLQANPDRDGGAGDGFLWFSTPLYCGLSREDAARHHVTLLDLTKGALGELSFDLFDTDYGSLCATGHSRAELASYLDPAQKWDSRRYRLTVRLKPDDEPLYALRLAINEYAGIDKDSPLIETVNHTPIARLPRWIHVEGFPGQQLDRIEGWNHRIRLCWAPVPEPLGMQT